MSIFDYKRTVKRFAFVPTMCIGNIAFLRPYFEDQEYNFSKCKWESKRRYIK